MKNYQVNLLMIIFLFLNIYNAASQPANKIEDWLGSMEGLNYKKTPLDSAHQNTYTLFLEQAIDWDHPEKGSFQQRIYLTHSDKESPIVMVTEGYAAHRNYLAEPTKILDANQIIVEHRYFGESVPDSLDWSSLTTENAARDHHHIYEVFSQFYQNKWISTGISKGGQTTIFYKYFYPNDMDICIPYVAPLNVEQEDSRINWFLRNVGTKDDQARILNYQRLMLINFDSIFPLFQEIAKDKEKSFAIDDTLAYEFMVLEFPFSFWQWGSLHKDSIPKEYSSPSQMLRPMYRLGLIDFYYQSTLDALMPFMVQAYRELGYYNYDLDSLRPYLIKMENSSNIAFVPPELMFEYDQELMRKVYHYIHNEGHQFIYIYGELDPWSSTSINPDSRVDAIKMVLAGGSHGTRLRHFTKEQQKQIKEQLQNWLKN